MNKSDLSLLQMKLKRLKISHKYENGKIFIGKTKLDYLNFLSLVLLPLIGAVITIYFMLQADTIRLKFIILILGLLSTSFFNLKRILDKMVANKTLKIIGTDFIKIKNKDFEQHFTKNNSRNIQYNIKEHSAEVFMGNLFLVDNDNIKHELLGFDDENEQFVNNDLKWLSDFLTNHLNLKISPIKIDKSNPNTKNLMEEDLFWKIISTSLINSKNIYEEQQIELKKELLKLEPIQVVKFDNKFRSLRGVAYNWDLWGAAYIINGGCSDDCFMDFRDWLIGQGKDTFEDTIKNPENLLNINSLFNDDFLGLSFITSDVYKDLTGNQMPNGITENIDINGEEWFEDEEVLSLKFPRLWRKYQNQYD